MGIGPIGIILEDIAFLPKIRPPETEYSVIKFGSFYIASYLNLLVSSLSVTVLYWGS